MLQIPPLRSAAIRLLCQRKLKTMRNQASPIPHSRKNCAFKHMLHTIGCATCLTAPVAITAAGLPNLHPNLLLILTDDQGWGDLGINGNPYVSTPFIDSLFAKGVVFEHFYVSPVSAPTRASLLTGRYHLRTGVCNVQNGNENMNPNETTLAELLRDAGYATGCFGKWHNGAYYPYTPNGQGFDEFLGFCCGHWATYFDPILQHNETTLPRSKGYMTDLLTNAAIDFIESNHDRPFFCYIPYNAPHTPLQVPDAYFNRHAGIRTPQTRTEDDSNALACIYGMTENIDYNVGRILRKLDELQLRDNTIIVYLSDNGPVRVRRYNGGMRGTKGAVHEGGVRVPCVINWQSELPHRVITNPAAHIDLLPTLMELLGIRHYQTTFPLDGISLARHLRNTKREIPDREIFTHRMLGNQMTPYLGAVRTKHHRLTIHPDSVQLYELTTDPGEHLSIYNCEKRSHRKLLSRYLHWYDDASQGIRSHSAVPVGYEASPEIRIPVTEGSLHGRLRYNGYPNQNWVNHFGTPADSVSLNLDVVCAGKYAISIEYGYTGNTATARAIAHCSGARACTPIPPFNAAIIPGHDRARRQVAPERNWGHLRIGTLHLTEGPTRLTFYSEGVSRPDTLIVKTVILNRLSDSIQ